ncbi:MAG: hypothetical protein HWN66_14995 [Candidatus Helarchaeota archaeon]|nr:hypothetical protein [Candidatus Helarchaeota archaeon]
MPLFKIWKKFPFPTPLLKQYFMCHRVWQKAMPYKAVEIKPEHKFRWIWKVKDKLNFILFKLDFEHTFTSVQEEHEDYLFIKFENSNQVKDFSAKILYEEKGNNPIENKVILQIDKMNLKNPILNTVKIAFIEMIKKDYKIFLNNVHTLLQQKQERLQILEDCYWTDHDVIQFPDDEKY